MFMDKMKYDKLYESIINNTIFPDSDTDECSVEPTSAEYAEYAITSDRYWWAATARFLPSSAVHVCHWASTLGSMNRVLVAFGIDKLQLNMLCECSFKLCFGSTYAMFKGIAKKQGSTIDWYYILYVVCNFLNIK